jgi:hypothetical protein
MEVSIEYSVDAKNSELTSRRISYPIPKDACVVPLDLLPQSGIVCIRGTDGQ